MRVRLLIPAAEPFALDLAELPRVGDTLSLPEPAGVVWRVRRVHWPLDAKGEGVEVHLMRAALDPE